VRTYPPDLFVPYQKHSPTSKAAAEAVEPRAKTLRANVLAFIRARGSHGATDAEIQSALFMDGSTERPRRVELLEPGLIRQRGTRPTASGRQAAVWIATQENRDV
jgi:hypothetical protein